MTRSFKGYPMLRCLYIKWLSMDFVKDESAMPLTGRLAFMFPLLGV